MTKSSCDNYSHPKNFQRDSDGNNFYEVDMTKTKEEVSMSFTENDYNLLRPFDPDAVKIGDKVSVFEYCEGVVVHGPNQRREFVFDIVDYGYLVVCGGHVVQYGDVTVMKTL